MSAFLYLLLCAWTAAAVARRFAAERGLVAVTVFFGAVLLPFHALGLLELMTGWPGASVGHAALLLLLAVLTLRLVPAMPAGFPWPRGQREVLPWLTLAVLTLAVFLLAGAMLAFGRPQGYEVMAYHLPLSVDLLQTHSLMGWDRNFPHTFPANASVLWAVLLDWLPERLVSSADLVLLVPLVMAVHTLCRQADADRKASLYACCGLLGVPMVAFSSVELGADIGGMAFAALAMCFVLSSLRPPLAMALAGLCMGLAIGFKSLHLLSAVAVGLVACARGGNLAGALRNAAMFGTVASLASGFWLLRNAIVLGNPLHPVGVPLIGKWMGWLPAPDFDLSLRQVTQLEWVSNTWQWLVYPWMETQHYGQNFKHSSGLGAFVATAIPGTAVALAAAAVRDGPRLHRMRLSLLFAVLFIVAAWFLLGDRQPRYVLGALPLALPLLAWVVTQATGQWRRVFDITLAVCIVAMLGVFLSRQALQFGDRIVLSRQTARAAFYEYPPLLDALPAGSTILNTADRSWHYPLFGAALSNRVVSMPQARRMMGLPPSLSAPRELRLAAAPLRAAGVTHVFVTGTSVTAGACLQLDNVAQLDRNPVNGMPLGSPRTLYAVRYRCP